MTYRDEVLADAPVLFFEFEDNLTNDGSLAPSVTSNAVTYAAGTRGQAGVFDGTSSYVQASTTSPYYGSEWAVEAYFKAQSTNDYNTIVRRSGSQHVLLRVRGSAIGLNANRLECYVAGNSGAVTSFISSVNVNDNAWHHAVLTQRSGTIYMYVDGVQVGSGAGVGSITSLTSAQQIGREASGSEFFKGSLDEVAIYDHALTAARVAAHYNASDVVPTVPLVLDAGFPDALGLSGLQGPTVSLGTPVVTPLYVESGWIDVLALAGLQGPTIELSTPTPPDTGGTGEWFFEVLMPAKAMDAYNPTASLEVRNDRKRLRPELKTLVRV